MPQPYTSHPARRAPGTAAARALGFFAFWLVLVGLPPMDDSLSAGLRKATPDLIVGSMAAAAAAWLSVRLMPPGAVRFNVAGLARLAVHFVRQSVVAGVDVARRAFHPRLPLQPGFMEHQLRLPAGPGRDAFTALTSLLPGTLPVCAPATGAVLYHCLDTRQPVARQLAADEAVFSAALRTGASAEPAEPRANR